MLLGETLQHLQAQSGAVLLADVGGTNCRFALAIDGGRPERVLVIDNRQVADFESAVARYFEVAGMRAGAAVLAVAGPIADGDDVALTNREWRFQRSHLAERFGFSHLEVINDFEAIAWALPQLDAADLRLLGPPVPARNGVKIVLGPGTGLGVAALMPIGEGWHVASSEAGHVSLGALARDEAEVLGALLQQRGFVSAESILSGPGLARLMHAIAPQDALPTPEDVLARASSGDAQARAAVDLFVRALGRFAGDMALTFKAFGGVYLTGGVVGGLGSLLDAGVFRAAFEAHPPHEKMLAAIATSVIACAEPGLIGCAVRAAAR